MSDTKKPEVITDVSPEVEIFLLKLQVQLYNSIHQILVDSMDEGIALKLFSGHLVHCLGIAASGVTKSLSNATMKNTAPEALEKDRAQLLETFLHAWHVEMNNSVDNSHIVGNSTPSVNKHLH